MSNEFERICDYMLHIDFLIVLLCNYAPYMAPIYFNMIQYYYQSNTLMKIVYENRCPVCKNYTSLLIWFLKPFNSSPPFKANVSKCQRVKFRFCIFLKFSFYNFMCFIILDVYCWCNLVTGQL